MNAYVIYPYEIMTLINTIIITNYYLWPLNYYCIQIFILIIINVIMEWNFQRQRIFFLFILIIK